MSNSDWLKIKIWYEREFKLSSQMKVYQTKKKLT